MIRKKELMEFEYGNCKLLDGKLKKAFLKGYKYYMSISVDDMLYELRKKCGIENKNGSKSLNRIKGSWFGLGGNVLGQWLQVYPRFYKVTGNIEALNKANELVNGLHEISKYNKVLFDGLFMYFFEKYLRGFLENYIYCNNRVAYDMAKDFILEAINDDKYKNPRLILGNNGPDNEIEWYTITESILMAYDVFKSNDEDSDFLNKILDLANRFRYMDFWTMAYNKENILNHSPLAGQNIEFFHSYSHLNTFNSAMKFYELTKDDFYLKASINFYDYVRNKQEVATGGYGTHKEWYLPKGGIINAIKNYHDSFETQCDSYAVYRLSNTLIRNTGESRFGNWEEKLLYNATLATIDMTKVGRVMYYSDYNTKGAKKVLFPPTWTCCTGTRPLLLSELTRSIYFYDQNNLYVNLYTESIINYKDLCIKAIDDIELTDELHFKVIDNKNNLGILFRNPEWNKKIKIFVNEKETKYEIINGWIKPTTIVKKNDTIKVIFKKELEISKIVDTKVSISAVNYGPLTLALKRDTTNDNRNAIDFKVNIENQLLRKDREFTINGTDYKMIPYMDFKKNEEYYLYFETEE